MNKEKSLFIKCSCHCCGLSIEKLWPGDGDDAMSLSFWIDKFYAYQSSGFFRNLWERIKLAFKVLTKGDYFLQDIIVEKNEIQKLKEYFNQF